MARDEKLVRRRDEALLAGVCAGLAHWLGWGVNLTRLVFVLVSICSAAFPGILVYVILWIVMPKE